MNKQGRGQNYTSTLKKNKQAITETMKSIKFSNKIIRKFAQKIAKYVKKINDREGKP